MLSEQSQRQRTKPTGFRLQEGPLAVRESGCKAEGGSEGGHEERALTRTELQPGEMRVLEMMVVTVV